jgi:hypothetical protein
MRAYFLTVDGMEDELDAGMNRLWPLEMIKPVEEELQEHHKTAGTRQDSNLPQILW